jgi:glutaredoxin
MLILYALPSCPYCAKVRNYLSENNIEFKELDARDSGIQEELIKRGGKRSVPYLVDEDKNIEMYESDDIVKYLEENYINVPKN